MKLFESAEESLQSAALGRRMKRSQSVICTEVNGHKYQLELGRRNK